MINHWAQTIAGSWGRHQGEAFRGGAMREIVEPRGCHGMGSHTRQGDLNMWGPHTRAGMEETERNWRGWGWPERQAGSGHPKLVSMGTKGRYPPPGWPDCLVFWEILYMWGTNQRVAKACPGGQVSGPCCWPGERGCWFSQSVIIEIMGNGESQEGWQE